MIIFNSNVVGTILAIIVAGGLIFGAGNMVNNQLDQVAKHNQPQSTSKPVSEAPTTPSPSPNLKAAIKNTQAVKTNTNSDPIINCDYPHTGRMRVKQSECDGKKVDCEVEPGKWQVVWKEDCDALRAKEKREAQKVAGTITTKTDDSKKENTKLIDCIFDDSWGKSRRYNNVTKEACDELIQTWTKHEPLKKEEGEKCVLSYGTYEMSKSACEDAKKRDMELLQKDLDRYVDRALSSAEDCVAQREKLLREHDEDVRRAAQSAMAILSAKGAGDSSAAHNVTQTIYDEGNRKRKEILNMCN